jgi:hypothetical protein
VLAEDVFARHNRDDRPDGQLCPSMSIGDVVMFGELPCPSTTSASPASTSTAPS